MSCGDYILQMVAGQVGPVGGNGMRDRGLPHRATTKRTHGRRPGRVGRGRLKVAALRNEPTGCLPAGSNSDAGDRKIAVLQNDPTGATPGNPAYAGGAT